MNDLAAMIAAKEDAEAPKTRGPRFHTELQPFYSAPLVWLRTGLRPLAGQGYGPGMTIATMVLALLALVLGVWSMRRGQKQLAALPTGEFRVMRQTASVAFWFCQGGALFLVVYGVRMIGVLDYRLAILIWLFAVVFSVTGIALRYMTHRSRDA